MNAPLRRLEASGEPRPAGVWKTAERRASGARYAAAATPAAGHVAGWAERLLADGYCIIPGAKPVDAIDDLSDELVPRFRHTPFCEGLFFGYHTKRIQSLLKRTRGAAALVTDPLVLGITQAALGPYCDRFLLNLTEASELHPAELEQIPHRDDDIWPIAKTGMEFQVNVMWPLTDFTRDNGATRIWPGSHGERERGAYPAEDAIVAEMAPGDALLWLGSTMHCGGANRTGRVRRGIIISYCLGWLRTYEDMARTYPPEIASGFPPALSELLGYVRHRPNLGNVDGGCPSRLLRRAIDMEEEPHAASEALLPWQQPYLEAHAARQQAA